ncbi:hypothetical protein KP003_17305 [Geomonas nitrogeniifigens]|uniref:Uncharacterized protein n=1 Tax=Geomonas diazotrophica TaxID=2843197 RepID=A0ABX8JEU6_9BACT|nr:hypothetical protein [Geomonas nitrogeniifigens]QWV96923.1 hypothetical protein KP005_16455 [Geomonas nitrogeniifigens]QXE86099.1 hypothetical protein KP003_17305 [Geomonas nitrogeniifigens]
MMLTDILILDQEELKLVRDKYIDCKLDKLSPSDSMIQQYRITIDVDNENSYYNFLLDNCIAMSSHNFYFRVKVDTIFFERIRRRRLA